MASYPYHPEIQHDSTDVFGGFNEGPLSLSAFDNPLRADGTTVVEVLQNVVLNLERAIASQNANSQRLEQKMEEKREENTEIPNLQPLLQEICEQGKRNSAQLDGMIEKASMQQSRMEALIRIAHTKSQGGVKELGTKLNELGTKMNELGTIVNKLVEILTLD